MVPIYSTYSQGQYFLGDLTTFRNTYASPILKKRTYFVDGPMITNARPVVKNLK